MLLFWVVMAFVVFINVLASTMLPIFEGFILVLHIIGFFAILLPLAVLGEHQDFYQVFGLWLNECFLPSQGVSFMEIFMQATGSVAGATIMAFVITIMQLFANVGSLASRSRMSCSFARDRGLPDYKTLSKVFRSPPEIHCNPPC